MEKEKLNVMVIEDHAGTRKLLTMEFRRRGHNVLEYADSATAVGALEKKRYPLDVAVVDLINLGYGGTAGDWLRDMEEYRDIPVIFYSGLTRRQFDGKILRTPNTYYMHKDPGSIPLVAEKAENAVRAKNSG